jgi:DNA-binding transcriptional LysR family regulator
MLESARVLLQEAEQFRLRANERAVISGRCRFGTGELSSLTWMPKFISSLRESHPLLMVEPHVDMGQMLELKLEDGEIDFAVIARRSTRVAIASHIVGEAEFSWVAAPFIAASGEKMTLAALEDQTLITMPNAAGSISILDKWLMANDIEFRQRMVCANLGAVAGLLREGLGVGYLPKAWADHLVARGDLVFLSALAPLEPLRYAFQWRRDDSRIMIPRLRALVARTINFKLSTGMI